MKKHFKFWILLLNTTILSFGFLTGHKVSKFNSVQSVDATYTFTFDSSSNLKLTSAESSAKECVRNTALGNPISLNVYEAYSSSGNYFCKLLPDGYIRNDTPLRGITNIKIIASHRPFSVSVGSTYDTYSIVNSFNSEMNTSMTEYNCPITGSPDYFSIDTPHTSEQGVCYIKSVVVTYTCTVAPSTNGIEYTYSGEEKNVAGYAEGEIKLTADSNFAVNDELSFYWGKNGEKLLNYYPIYQETISSSKNVVLANVDENVVIPQEANQVLAYTNNALTATYNIPAAKQNSETLIHKFAVISDVHCNTVQGQKHLENALEVMENKGVEYIIISGDLGETNDQYAQYRDACINSNFDGLIFSCIGNHDQKDAGRANFKQYAIYDGGAKQFVPLANAESYFGNTYIGSLPVEFFYDDLEGGDTNYYYVTIADNLYFFMDQMLGETGGTTSMDNFSETQIDLLENTLLKYSGDHTGDTDFAYDKYNLNVVEHAPVEQLKVGDVFTPKYGGQILLSYRFKNNHKFVELIKEYAEMNLFTGHTHVQYDVGINFLDKYYNECGELTDISTAHNFHVSSLAQPRWYKSSGSMSMVNDYSAGSEGYIGYQYESNIVIEGNSYKEYIEEKTTYDPSDYCNHIYSKYSYIVPTGVSSHQKLGVVDYAIAANGVSRQGSPSWQDTANGLQITFSGTGDRFEIKTGDQTAAVSSGYNLEFKMKSSVINALTLGGCNYTGLRYTSLSISIPSGGSGYTVEALEDDWYKVVVPLSTLYSASCGDTFAVRFYGPNTAGTMLLKDMFIKGTDLTLRGDDIYYARNYTKTFAADVYTLVTFEYLLTNNGSISVAIVNDSYNKYYGYFNFNKNGAGSAYAGVSTETLDDGFIKVTLDLALIQRTNNANNRNNVPESISRFMIRGDWSTAVGCIDNITFGFKSGDEPVYRGEQIVAGEDKSIEFEKGSYSVVEFDYKIISESGTTFSFALLDTESSGWSLFYGLFDISASGGNFSGMTFSTLSDGYIHLTINVSQLTKSGNLNNLNSAPEAFNIIFIRGGFSTATAYIDNVIVTL